MRKKIDLKSDYSEIGHPGIIQAIHNASLESHGTYGLDIHTEEAKTLIKQKIGRNDIDIHLIHGGTPANIINLSLMLRPYESVVACDSGHISVHETGAIEATGHKINTVKNHDGKLKGEDINTVLKEHHFEHMVMPRAVYITQPSEYGVLYSRKELSAISLFCRENNLYGSRLLMF